MEYASLSSADIGSALALWSRHRDNFNKSSKRHQNILDHMNQGEPSNTDCHEISEGYYATIYDGILIVALKMDALGNPEEIIKNPDGFHILRQHVDALVLCKSIQRDIRTCTPRKVRNPVKTFI